MNFLHPVFTIITIILIIYSFLEVSNDKKDKSLWGVIVVMIILIGFRGVGADFGVYEQMYYYFGEKVEYSAVFNRAMFGDEQLDVEWFYTLVGKWLYDLKLPFFIFTLFIAIISIGLKQISFSENTMYPALGMLLYLFPSYFTADGGHMRQAVAMGITMFAFIYIKERRLLPFLFMIYLAMGFHKSAFIFLFAYWWVLLPLSSSRILFLILISVILSPFKVYEHISLLDSIAPAEVYEGFQAYETIEEQNTGSIKLMDLICTLYAYFLVTFNKESCRVIPYYEYMRNIGVAGVCIYFVFRGSPIFSTRLAAYYFIYMTMVLPNIIGAIKTPAVKRMSHLVLVVFVVFYYFVYAKMQAPGAGYTWDRYSNLLFFW